MSRRALLEAVRDTLKSVLHFESKECEITDMSGRPPPMCGKRFIAVHRAGRRGKWQVALDEIYDVAVTVTMRVEQPYDRIGKNLLEKQESGMDDLCDRIRSAISVDSLTNDIINAANVILGITVNGFIEPLYFQDDNDIRIVSGDWFHADPEAVEVGIACTMKFTGARRIQPLAYAS